MPFITRRIRQDSVLKIGQPVIYEWKGELVTGTIKRILSVEKKGKKTEAYIEVD